uniref:Uncharacterized protein n=1 Tax=Anguilla anguilla TaxID=7936 RepID=A0A0E9S1N1_ANGAN
MSLPWQSTLHTDLWVLNRPELLLLCNRTVTIL